MFDSNKLTALPSFHGKSKTPLRRSSNYYRDLIIDLHFEIVEEMVRLLLERWGSFNRKGEYSHKSHKYWQVVMSGAYWT